MRTVTFPYDAIAMAGHLYLPPDFDASRQYPAIVVAHPYGGVKEQTAGLYARKLYDRPEYVGPAVEKLASFYGRSL
jgi:uncharacterized protein